MKQFEAVFLEILKAGMWGVRPQVPEGFDVAMRRFLELDYLNYDMMATAGFRLAALLNDTIK